MLVIAVVGPTATGKSDLGVALARQLGGEVVNADAMQLYRGMDIGTAKLTPAERERVPHHLLDVLDVSEEASVAAYQRAVRVCVDDLVARGSVPVLVGGSGLYVRAALDELQIPPTDRAVRARLERAAEELGAAALHARLAEVDPVAAERILPTNSRRVVRALEVVELTGRPFSATLPEPRYLRPTVQIGLRAARPELDDRIARRVERMWQAGLLDEVSRLVPQGLREGRTASRAVGYAQALAQLDGVLDAEQAQQQTAQLTRRLARRQESWFGRDARITWLDSGAPDVLERALRVVRAAAEGVDGR
ncbi:tRNA (adenosine(37)-N6)-dimethylallyltransferase MiaA [Angustibacter sp. Root456]|uniref:tRNA (adenosine(37)-N6)-dimethylallyltransferase MiaA n=1 Tax=Angustibacter sp. Root456 TaxID=1736539 RepID=UPI001F014AE2|nr:tRNA (adenosine(37)-N6)-dimethylallyltransferase MiaA [Angustibacter sp. Root456]